MEETNLIWIATKCFDKNYDFETLKYSDDLYGKEYLAEEVWEFVEELEEIGIVAFKEKYKNFKLYF